MASKPDRVLIIGAGVAGSVLAYWLARYDYEVVVVERSRSDQKIGQGIEIEEPALSVVKAMGIYDELKAKKTSEKGFELVNENSKSCGIFEAGRFSPTGALELMRGDLTEVLYRAADKFDTVTYQFETTVQSLTQKPDKVTVELEERTTKARRTEEFDFVIGADGVKSRTRNLIMGSPETLKCYKPIGAYVAYFSIPKQDIDHPYSQACHFPDRRVLWTRPISTDSPLTSVYLIYVKDEAPMLSQANASGDRNKQKEALTEIFGGLGWQADRIVSQMNKATNFYSDELMQVKLSKWSSGRVALVGDAAWAPTPFTGEGNQLAIKGAWVLAQEMSRNRSPLAFEKFDSRFRAHVEGVQEIPLYGYGPYILCPETSWGISLLQNTMWSASLMVRFFSWMGWFNASEPAAPDHDFDLEMPPSIGKQFGR